MAKNKATLSKRIGAAKSKMSAKLKARLRRLLRWGLVLAAVLILVPTALIFIYASPSVNPVSTLMLGRWASLQYVSRQWVDLKDINPVLVHSVMMSEDAKFCAHNGVDWSALNSVIDDAIEGEKTRGASTLSMQVVKNLFLWPGRSYVRKVLELPLALLADKVWSKKRMIEIYLNIAEWDEGIFGIKSASLHYFARSPKVLNAKQSALLAVTLPNPKYRNPAKPSKTLSRLAKNIKSRAYQSGAYVRCVR